MTKYDFFGFRVEIDEAATRDWYAQADEWDCDCGDCRNFLKLAHERALPAPVLELLDGLGIPPAKATYVCMMYNSKAGYLYEFSYRVAGNILAGDETSSVPWEGGNAWCHHEPYPYGAPDFPEPHFDVGFYFYFTLPWALDEPRK